MARDKPTNKARHIGVNLVPAATFMEVMDPNAVLTLVDRPDVAALASEIRGLLVQALEKL
jgi:hypothetical protein